MKLNLVTVVGDFHYSLTLVQMLKHYFEWVDNIYINLYNTENLHMSPGQLLDYLKKWGVEGTDNKHIYTILREGKKYDWDKVTEFYNDTTATATEAYWIIADCDEFQMWPHHPKHVAWQCEEMGYTFVTGGFVDRIGRDGIFPEVTGPDADLDKLFPLAGFFRYPMSKACPNKVVMVKGGQKVCSGQHYAVFDDGTNSWGREHRLRFPIEDCFVQVHHMKWDLSVLQRLTETVESGCRYSDEYARMYKEVVANEGRIDVLNKKYYIEEYEPELEYDSYRHWNKLREIIVKI